MLSSFAYQQVINGIKVNGYKFGINIKEVDPSYTSIIGKNKYAIPLGLSVHQAAAFVIARRGYAYKEKIKQARNKIISKRFSKMLINRSNVLVGDFIAVFRIFLKDFSCMLQ